jgi:phenylalanyl-tRNA synthetase beta chain
MKISYNWLKQFVPIKWEAQKTAELLTDLGLEVEGIVSFESVKGGLKGVVVGKVLQCEKHPNADKLALATVDAGGDKQLKIVCGAPNIAKGQNVAVATIGTRLYTTEGEEWTIKKGKIRGELSEGMICAEDELGLGDKHDGIMVLNEDLKPGTPCAEIFNIETDEVFEIGLTPNRADAMSHFGVARDLKAGLLQRKIHAQLNTPSVSNFTTENRSLRIDVEVAQNALAPRYCGVTISNLIVQPSPHWLQNRLKAIGLKPINNVVDATNYVLHELGQPLHAFDADRVYGRKVIVKTVKGGTPFMTLDGVERALHEEDLMICDAEKPMCIAGVFGGINTGVTENTKAIFLESAYFDPVSIRKTAKRHALNTDASFRFERGTDINNVEYALRRAALLIRDLTGGAISSDVIDLYPKRKDDYQVFLTFERINNLIGQEIPKDTIKSILASLDIQVKNVTESGLGLIIPFYRVDVRREVDVIEEILRVYGYNNIEFKEKLHASVATSSRFEDYKLENIIGDLLVSQGFYETLSNSLTNPAYQEILDVGDTWKPVRILNPLSTELSVLRQSLLPSVMEAVRHNANRRKQDLKLYEFGAIYQHSESTFLEKKQLAVLVKGNREEETWITKPRKADFFYLKAIVELVLHRLGITSYNAIPSDSTSFTEGMAYQSRNETLVRFGVLNRKILDYFEIKGEALYAEFEWPALVKHAANSKMIYEEVPRFPSVRRDFALLLDQDISFRQVYDLAFQTEKKLLKKVNLFDVYRGKNLPENKKSYAVSFMLQDAKKTLTDAQIEKTMNRLQQKFEKELKAELR